MKRALVCTSFLLLPKLSCRDPFDKTCIENTELKIEIMNIAIDRKTDGVTVASLTDSNYFDPQAPSSLLQLQHNNNRQRNNSTNFPVRWDLRASFVIVLTHMQKYFVKSFLLRVYFENVAKCDKKTVTATSLEDQPCQI